MNLEILIERVGWDLGESVGLLGRWFWNVVFGVLEEGLFYEVFFFFKVDRGFWWGGGGGVIFFLFFRFVMGLGFSRLEFGFLEKVCRIVVEI